MVYWSHRKPAVDFLTEEDQALYTKELKNLRRGYRVNQIFVIKAGLDLEINGGVFNPLLLDFNGLVFPEYMMLCGSGLVDDMAYIPYLFTSKKARQNAMMYLAKARKENGLSVRLRRATVS